MVDGLFITPTYTKNGILEKSASWDQPWPTFSAKGWSYFPISWMTRTLINKSDWVCIFLHAWIFIYIYKYDFTNNISNELLCGTSSSISFLAPRHRQSSCPFCSSFALKTSSVSPTSRMCRTPRMRHPRCTFAWRVVAMAVSLMPKSSWWIYLAHWTTGFAEG